MQKVRQISSGGRGDGVETEACSLIGNSGSDGQPVKTSEYLGDESKWRCTDYKTDCTVQDSEVCQELRENQPRQSCNGQCVRVRKKQQESGGIIGMIVADNTNTSDFQESSFADEMYVLFNREILVQVETKVPDSQKEMVAWQVERRAGGCLSFEELNSIPSVFLCFGWSLFSLKSDMQIWRTPLVLSWCSGLHDLRI